MSFPLMNKRARQGVVIPELSGGLNLRDSVSMVNDNQLTDSVNMWFKDGVLKTRPGLEHKVIGTYPPANIDAGYSEPKFWDIYTEKYDVIYQLLSFKEKDANLLESTYTFILRFVWCNQETTIDFPPLVLEYEAFPNYFVVQHKTKIYCYLSTKQIYEFDYSTLDVTSTDLEWKLLTEEDYYAPIVLTHCKTTASVETRGTDELLTQGATQFEGYNLIGKRYRMIYSTVNINLLESEDSTHPMIYPLIYNATAMAAWYPDEEFYVIAKLTRASDGQTFEHKVEVGYALAVEDEHPGDNLYMKVNGYSISFHDENGKVIAVSRKDYLLDNLEITAPCPNSEENLQKVFFMTRSEWFGGASAGINGGTRLFLSGNIADKNKNLVVWSGLNDPLYFSENCYFRVGNDSQAVTAFGKQDNMLAIFKENETYFTQYTQNDGITADNLIDQSVVDYTANNVYFPLTLIHSGIGCDCPDTVQLCRNRLVWANSNGKVYTLTSANQYSERNIYEVGEMLERKLKNEAGLKYATSCDWEGHYVLFVNNHAYLMDYNSSGYQYVYSYQKEENANSRIPWYYWEFPETGKFKKIFVSDNLLSLANLEVDEDNKACLCIYALKNTEYDEFMIAQEEALVHKEQQLPIRSTLTTKLFNFGAPGHRKNVDLVQLSLGNNGGTPISVDFVTDCGTVTEEITLESSETENYTAGYVSSVALNPCIRSVLRFGVRLSCEGTLAVDGMTLNYRLLGGAR